MNEWVIRAVVDAGVREGVTTSETRRTKKLEREVRYLRHANEILKSASAFFAQGGLDYRLKSLMSSSTNIAIPSGSIRSSRSFRLPRRLIEDMLRCGARPTSVVSVKQFVLRIQRVWLANCMSTALTRFATNWFVARA